jgi:hypothetical protein
VKPISRITVGRKTGNDEKLTFKLKLMSCDMPLAVGSESTQLQSSRCP